jgi:hypothetical protein
MKIYKIIILIVTIYLIGTLIRVTRYTTLYPFFSMEITFDNLPTGVLPYNSSISKEGGNYVVYTRIDNCGSNNFDKLKRYIGGIKIDRTPVYLGKTIFDKNFNVLEQNIIDPAPGIMLEDLRVFFWKGQKYFIGTKWEGDFYPYVLKENGYGYEMYDILGETGKYIGNKNFMPINIGSELFLIVNHNPLEIVRVFINDQKNAFYTTPYFSSKFREDIPKLRGNTPYIDIGNGRYLGITHTLNFWMMKNYVHHVTIINAQDPTNIYIEKVGSSMCLLGNCGIEFVMGLVESYERGKYVITLGKEDMSAHLVEVTNEELDRYFE